MEETRQFPYRLKSVRVSLPTRMKTLGWDIVAGTYDFVYSPLVHEIDMVILDYLGDKIRDAVVVDACCGTGQMAFKSAIKGAKKVFAIDSSSKMIQQMKKRKEYEFWNGQVSIIKSDILDDAIARLGNVDIVYFRRCLYFTDEENSQLISDAYGHLNQGGAIVVVHPEKNISQYCRNGKGGFALIHFLRRAASWVGTGLRLNDYKAYTAGELEAICREACLDGIHKTLEAPLPAYNIRVIEKGTNL